MTEIGISNSTKMLDSGGGVHYMKSVIDGLSQGSDYQITVYFEDPMLREDRSTLPRTEWRLIPDNRTPIETIAPMGSDSTVRLPVLGMSTSE